MDTVFPFRDGRYSDCLGLSIAQQSLPLNSVSLDLSPETSLDAIRETERAPWLAETGVSEGVRPELFLPLETAWSFVARHRAREHVPRENQRAPLFPSLIEFNAAFHSLGVLAPASGCGVPITLVPQPGRRQRLQGAQPGTKDPMRALEAIYQARLFLKGELLTRCGHPHDAFNALCHLTFPLAKATLNARQFWALDARTGGPPWSAAAASNRTAEQDALTHFDEGGVVVACACPRLLAMLRARQWKELFWERRGELEGAMEFFVFGHAIYEVALAGHPTPHASGLAVSVGSEFFSRTLSERLAEADVKASFELQKVQTYSTPKAFFPVPVLGVPGYCAENARPEYYGNSRYFRS